MPLRAPPTPKTKQTNPLLMNGTFRLHRFPVMGGHRERGTLRVLVKKDPGAHLDTFGQDFVFSCQHFQKHL